MEKGVEYHRGMYNRNKDVKKMKKFKILVLLLVFVLSLSICACSNTNNSETTNSDNISNTNNNEATNGDNISEGENEIKLYTATESGYKNAAISAAKEYLLGCLKNPNSLVINGASIYQENDEEYRSLAVVNVDYSAQNGFGGMNREILQMQVTFIKATNKYTAKRY